MSALTTTASRLSLAILLGLGCASAEPNYNPAARYEGKFRLRLPAGSACEFPPRSMSLPAGFALDARDDGPLWIRGGGRKPWSLELPSPMCEWIWVHDLDRNGKPDVLIGGPTHGNGTAPVAFLFVVMVDEQDRPMPWVFYPQDHGDEHGPSSLFDFNRDGRAEFLQTHHEHSDRDDFNYWIHSLYEARAALWHPVQGLRGPMRFPLFSKFTFQRHDLSSSFPPGLAPAIRDESNAAFGRPAVRIVRDVPVDQSAALPPQRTGKGLASYYRRADFANAPKLTFSDGRVCAYRSLNILSDDGDTRRWHEEDAHELVTLAVRGRWPAHVATSTEKGHCFVQGLWLKRGPATQR